MDVSTRTVEVSGDGAPMPVYVAEPQASGKFPVIVVFMTAFGLNEQIKRAAHRFSSEGYVVLVGDMFYRHSQGVIVGYDNVDGAIALSRTVYDAQTNADARVVIDFAKTLDKARADRIGCVGYCMGGTMSWLTACLNREIKAAAIYYSGYFVTDDTNPKRPISPHEYADLLTAPVLGCFGAEDQHPTVDEVRVVEARLRELGKVHDFKIYPGAGHGFATDDRPTYHEPSAEDAWARTLAWFEKYLKN